MLASAAECENCTAGFYCSKSGLTEPENPCKEGYYCPVGSKKAEQVDCPPGAYCPAGSDDPELCEKGTFQPNPRQWEKSQCQTCTEGMLKIFSFTIYQLCTTLI